MGCDIYVTNMSQKHVMKVNTVQNKSFLIFHPIHGTYFKFE